MHFKAKPTCGRIASRIKFYSSRITNAINFSPLVWNILHSLGMTKAVLFLFSTYSCCFTFSKTMLYIQLKRIALLVLREVHFIYAIYFCYIKFSLKTCFKKLDVAMHFFHQKITASKRNNTWHQIISIIKSICTFNPKKYWTLNQTCKIDKLQ